MQCTGVTYRKRNRAGPRERQVGSGKRGAPTSGWRNRIVAFLGALIGQLAR